MESFKKPICLLLVCAVFFAGCAGREANPMPVYLPGDENRSCKGLKAEIAQLQVDMARLLPKTDKGLTNALWAVGGVLVIVPFFFMDLKDAEKIEFDAMRKRHNRLLVYAAEKGCDMSGIRDEKIPEPKKYEKQLKEESKTQGTNHDSTIVPQETLNVEQKTNNDNALQAIYCFNCGHEIGRLEKAYLYESHVVCGECFKRLQEQP